MAIESNSCPSLSPTGGPKPPSSPPPHRAALRDVAQRRISARFACQLPTLPLVALCRQAFRLRSFCPERIDWRSVSWALRPLCSGLIHSPWSPTVASKLSSQIGSLEERLRRLKHQKQRTEART